MKRLEQNSEDDISDLGFVTTLHRSASSVEGTGRGGEGANIRREEELPVGDELRREKA
jgi:hypothetical protein